MRLSPIVLFTYKRLDTLRNTVEALKKNFLAKESELYVFSDGAKKEADVEVINQIRSYIKTIDGFKQVHVIESLTNKGLATSIINGVSTVIKKHKKVIVLEDDLLTTPNFLHYMNASLHQYELDRKVFSISGYSFDLSPDNSRPNDAYFFSRGWSWGWSTWEDRWSEVDWNVSSYQKFRVNLRERRQFAKGGSDLNAMLDKQMNGELDSWAIRWFYHQFRIGGLTLYPVYSKINNDGWDENATHTTGSARRYIPRLDTTHETSFHLPESISIDGYYNRLFLKKMNLVSRIRSKVETVLLKLTRQ